MGDARRVIICGNSLFLLAIEDSLRRVPALEVTRVNLHLPAATARVAALEPDVVIVDRSNGAGDLALELLHAQPELAVIGVDVARSVLTVFSSHQVAANSLDDLVQAIDKVSQGSATRVITTILAE